MKRIAIFASGSGSNFQAIVDACQEGLLDAEPALLICDKPGAYAIERAERAGIQAVSFIPKEYHNKAAYENAVLEQLLANSIDFIVLAGYMRLIGPTLLSAYKGRIVNIHPSLLPAFPGLDAIGQAFEYGVKVTGITIHFVDEGMDTGPIIAQFPIEVADDETRETLQKKIQTIEHIFYPKTLHQLLSNKLFS